MITSILTSLQKPYIAAQTANTIAFSDTASVQAVQENTTSAKKFLARLPTFSDATNLALFDSIINNLWQSVTVTPTQFLAQNLSDFIELGPVDVALGKLAPTYAPNLQNSFIEAVMSGVATYLYQQAKNTAVLSTMTTQFGLPQDLVQTVLMYAHIPPGNTNSSLNSILTSDVLIPPLYHSSHSASHCYSCIFQYPVSSGSIAAGVDCFCVSYGDNKRQRAMDAYIH
jgi:hypothetical protein